MIDRVRSKRLPAAPVVVAIIVLMCPVGAPAKAQPAAPEAPSVSPAQAGATVRVTRPTAVLENPRGDSLVVGAVDRGVVLPMLGQQGGWIQVGPPEGASWKRGWIQAGFVEVSGGGGGGFRPVARGMEARPPRPRGTLMVRGFAQASGTLFVARDSFETILGSTFGTLYGTGGQVVLPSGLFVQGGVDRFRKTGTSAIVSGEQVFRIDAPDTITVTPIQFSLGYRAIPQSRLVGYFGAGAGWHLFEEETRAVRVTEARKTGHVGYHVGGGAEYRIGPGVWLAGEIQFTAVPNALGESGVSAAFNEKNLGGTTFRVKILVGN